MVCSGVCVHVFISGWFGVTFSLSKVCRLVLTGMFCGGVAILVGKALGAQLSKDALIYIVFHQWYLCAYLLLMLVAPFLNLAVAFVTRRTAMTIVAPLFLLICWNWFSELKSVNSFVPWTPGLGSYTFVMMMCVYVIARLLRKLDVELDAKRRKAMALPVLFFALCALLGWRVRLGVYSSSIAIMLAGSLFVTFKGIRIGGASRMLTFIVPSLFPVYLFHGNQAGAAVIRSLETHMDAMACLSSLGFVGSVVICGVTACIIFLGCLVLDLPRRIFVMVCKNMLKQFWKRVDESYESLVWFVTRRMLAMLGVGAIQHG